MTQHPPWSPIRYQDGIRGAIFAVLSRAGPYHGGVGNLGFAVATSSGQTTADLPSCHWTVTAL
jgi:hypothetical protein